MRTSKTLRNHPSVPARFLSLLVALLMTLSGTLIFPFASASVDANGYTLIGTQTELSNIRNNLSGYYKLTNDIDLSGYWSPIGTDTANNAFTGVLDGNNHTIRGLRVSESSSAVGLFGATRGPASIRNLTLLNGSVSTSGTSRAGSFVGIARGSLQLTDCNSNLTISGNQYVGGMVGLGYLNNSYFSNCTFSGSATGSAYIGGIIGELERDSSSGSAPVIQRCRVVCDATDLQITAAKSATTRITATAQNAYSGGIAGQLVGTIKQCYSAVSVQGGGLIGGIVGKITIDFSPSVASRIEDCFSTGNITATATGGYVGGIVGNGAGNSSLTHTTTRCYASGNIENRSTNTGGITGYNGNTNTYSNISSCRALNNRVQTTSTSTTTTGRIAGAADSGYSSNYAKNDLVISWKNTAQTVTANTSGKHGGTMSVATLHTTAGYSGWDFNNIWRFDSNIYEYPVLSAIRPSPNPSPSALPTLTPDHLDLNVGEENTLTIGNLPSGMTFTVDFDTPNVASCTTSGNILTIKGLADGTTLLLVTLSDGTVLQSRITVELDPPKELVAAIEVGETVWMDGITNDNPQKQANMDAFTWSSSDASVATVDQLGKVTAVDLGLVTISASRNQRVATGKVLVRPAHPIPIDEIVVTAPQKVNIDTTHTATATILPNNTTVSDTSVTWSCRDTDILSIDPNTGEFTALQTGTTSIRATSNANPSIFGEVDVTVTRQPTAVRIVALTDINPIFIGDSVPFGIEVEPADATYETVTWRVSNTALANVGAKSGVLFAKAEGDLVLFAKVDDFPEIQVSLKIYNQSSLIPIAQWTTMSNFTTEDGILNVFADQGVEAGNATLFGFNVDPSIAPQSGDTALSAKNWQEESPDDEKAWVVSIPLHNKFNCFHVNWQQKGSAIKCPSTFALEYRIDGGAWKKPSHYQYSDVSTAWKTFTGSPSSNGYIRPPVYAQTLELRWIRVGNKGYNSSSIGADVNSLIRSINITGHQL